MNEKNHTDNFEKYLKEQAGDHRMYPSDHVWKNIRKKIHTPKKWPALSVFAVLTISALVIGTVLNKPVPDTATANFHFSLQSPANVTTEKITPDVTNMQAAITDEHYSVEQLTSNTIIAAVEKLQIDNALKKQLTEPADANENNLTVASNVTGTSEKTTAQKSVVVSQNKTATASSSPLNNINYYLFDITSRLKSILNAQPLRNTSGGVAFFN